MDQYAPIAAISTPYGKGGIAVIRISGENAIAIADRLFKPKNRRKLSDAAPNTAVYGEIISEGEAIDDGIATVFRAPRSFTGEDTVEVSCHGGIALTNEVLGAAFSCGCRPAAAGEFTKRAFLNGKISLSQAEAIGGLIDAKSREAVLLSSAQSRGVLRDEVKRISDEISLLLASVYAVIDYPDEDLADLSADQIKERAEAIEKRLDRLCSTYRSGRAICEGIGTVIIGKPNVGKSSILNLILGKDRAIVTGTAGTTRDIIEETVTVGKVLLRLCDTAGLRETDDEIESIGIKRAKEKLGEAELVLAVFDGSSPAEKEDLELIDELSKLDTEIIPILNKSDLTKRFDCSLLSKLGEPFICSAHDTECAEALKSRISELFVSGKIDYSFEAVISNQRQYAAAKEALMHVRQAISALSCGLAQDIAGNDLELAYSRLLELDGRQAASDITDKIFSHFCVGK